MTKMRKKRKKREKWNQKLSPAQVSLDRSKATPGGRNAKLHMYEIALNL